MPSIDTSEDEAPTSGVTDLDKRRLIDVDQISRGLADARTC